MKSLIPLPVAGSFSYFTAIAAAKQQPRRARLEALSPIIKNRYTIYAQHTSCLTSVTAIGVSDQEKQDLKHCYESPTGALNKLKLDIEIHHNNTCPDVAALCQYCGLKFVPDNFDHYLPKEQFPEFSVLATNLVPCCSECNSLKGTAWLDVNGIPEIINFYYDSLPIQRFLNVDVTVGPAPKKVPVADFSLSQNPEDFCGLMAIILNHYRKLDLLARYKRAAYAPFGNIKIEFAGLVQSKGREVVAQMLLKKANDLSLSRSPNYWEVALLSGMANSDEYLDSLP